MNTDAPDLGLRSRLEGILDANRQYVGTPNPLRMVNLFREIRLALSETSQPEVSPGLVVGQCSHCSVPILVPRLDPDNTMGMRCSVCAYRRGIADEAAKVSG